MAYGADVVVGPIANDRTSIVLDRFFFGDAMAMPHVYAGLHAIDNDLAVEGPEEWRRLAAGQAGNRQPAGQAAA